MAEDKTKIIVTTTVNPKHSSSNHHGVDVDSNLDVGTLVTDGSTEAIWKYMKCSSFVLDLASTLFTSGATQMICVLSNNIHSLHQYSDESISEFLFLDDHLPL